MILQAVAPSMISAMFQLTLNVISPFQNSRSAGCCHPLKFASAVSAHLLGRKKSGRIPVSSAAQPGSMSQMYLKSVHDDIFQASSSSSASSVDRCGSCGRTFHQFKSMVRFRVANM
jgi:hypothetical protein